MGRLLDINNQTRVEIRETRAATPILPAPLEGRAYQVLKLRLPLVLTPLFRGANGPEFFANGPELFSNGAKLFSNGAKLFSNGPELFSNGPEFLLSGPKFLLSGPEFPPTGPEFSIVGL